MGCAAKCGESFAHPSQPLQKLLVVSIWQCWHSKHG